MLPAPPDRPRPKHPGGTSRTLRQRADSPPAHEVHVNISPFASLQAPCLRRGPGRAVVVAIALSLLAAPAHAVVRYVSPSGNDSNTGLSPGTAWATIGRANSTLAAGDVCVVAPGTYSQPIQPAGAGTGSSARITYLGSIQNPEAVVVTSIELSKPWVTVKGFKSTGGASLLYPARNDSVAYCWLGGAGFSAAMYSMVARNTIVGDVVFLANQWRACFNGTTRDPGCTANCESDTLRGNHIDLGVIRPGDRPFKLRAFTQRCVIDSNRVEGVFNQSGLVEETWALAFYNAYNNTFRDNRWSFEAATAPPSNNQWAAFMLRDSSSNNLFERDTMLLGMNSAYPIRGMFSASGSFVNTVRGNRWNRCYYKTNSYLYDQNGFKSCTIENSVFASKADDAIAFTSFESSVLRHNLFYSGKQAINFGAIKGSGCDISSNVFYSASAGPAGSGGGVEFFGSGAQTGFRSDYNLFFTPAYTTRPGDRSIAWCCYGASPPGPGTAWNAMNGNDAHSRYGSPLLRDSSFAGLDPRPRAGSLAIGAGEGGSDAGPIPFVSGDTTPPGTVTNLAAAQVFDRSVLLAWTVPGDDGRTGTAAAYDLRWSRAPITETNFGSATVCSALPGPLDAGAVQSYLAQSLNPGTTYYFALKTRDEASNWSALSNVVKVMTKAYDTVPPAMIQDLGTSP